MGVLIAQATLAGITVRCTCSARLLNSKRESFIDFIKRPGAGYPRSEGTGAKFEVYLGRATAATALRVELEDIQTQVRHRSLRVPVEFLAAHWRKDHNYG